MRDDYSSSPKPPKLPKPSPYHITEPFQERGVWCFYLTAEREVLEYISRLNCILQSGSGSPFQRRLRGRVLFAINPRYDHEETWVWITDLLDSEAVKVELSDQWEQAIDQAQTPVSGDGDQS